MTFIMTIMLDNDQVGQRLSGEKFSLAVSSDLERARDTALAVTSLQPRLQLLQWPSLRDRENILLKSFKNI